MGIYDRDYYRDEASSWGGKMAMSLVAMLILINIAAYLLDALSNGTLHHYFALDSSLLREPWKFYQLITYGFLHDPGESGVWHIIFNMLGLYFFGRDTEAVYGRNEFLKIYLSLIFMSGLVWLVSHAILGDQPARLIGASGGVMGVMIIFVMHFPRRMFYFWGVVPVQAWLLATIFIVVDLFGMTNDGSGSNVAHAAHLGGAAFGYLYYQTHWCVGNLLNISWLKRNPFRSRPKLRVHAPREKDDSLNSEVDSILQKISREGEASLTPQERSRLEEASRRYQSRQK